MQEEAENDTLSETLSLDNVTFLKVTQLCIGELKEKMPIKEFAITQKKTSSWLWTIVTLWNLEIKKVGIIAEVDRDGQSLKRKGAISQWCASSREKGYCKR